MPPEEATVGSADSEIGMVGNIGLGWYLALEDAFLYFSINIEIDGLSAPANFNDDMVPAVIDDGL